MWKVFAKEENLIVGDEVSIYTILKGMLMIAEEEHKNIQVILVVNDGTET